MPLGSSSAAPVTKPGPSLANGWDRSRCHQLGAIVLFFSLGSFTTNLYANDGLSRTIDCADDQAIFDAPVEQNIDLPVACRAGARPLPVSPESRARQLAAPHPRWWATIETVTLVSPDGKLSKVESNRLVRKSVTP